MSLAVAVCMVPTFAFADEEVAPAEEATQQPVTVEQPAAEPVEEQAAEQEAEKIVENEETEPAEKTGEEASLAVAEDTVTTQGVTMTAKWDGYKFVTNAEGVSTVSYYNISNGDKGTVKILNGIADFATIIAKCLQTNKACQIFVGIDLSGKAVSKVADSLATFYKIPVQVTVGDKAKKDVVFVYGIDSYIVEKETELEDDDEIREFFWSEQMPKNPGTGGTYISELVDNAITVKKGESAGTGNLVLRTDYTKVKEVARPDSVGDFDYETFSVVIRENGNDGGYETDSSLWASAALYNSKLKSTYIGESATHLGFAKFANREEIKSFAAQLTEKVKTATFYEFYESVFTSDMVTFVHGESKAETKKSGSNKDNAVGTGDSMNLALFGGMAVLALIGAVAVFATRREQ